MKLTEEQIRLYEAVLEGLNDTDFLMEKQIGAIRFFQKASNGTYQHFMGCKYEDFSVNEIVKRCQTMIDYTSKITDLRQDYETHRDFKMLFDTAVRKMKIENLGL